MVMEEREYETLGIILNIKNFAENDSIVKVLLPSGIKFLFAKGIQKVESKNRRNLPILGLVNLEIIKSKIIDHISTLKRATLVSYFPINPTLQNIYEKTLFFLNRINNKDLEIFINRYNIFLNNVEIKPNHSLSFILLCLLEVFGFKPNFEHCVECKNKDNIIDFEFYKGGFLCLEHSKNTKGINFLQALYWLNKNFDYFKNNISEEESVKINLLIIEWLSSLI